MLERIHKKLDRNICPCKYTARRPRLWRLQCFSVVWTRLFLDWEKSWHWIIEISAMQSIHLRFQIWKVGIESVHSQKRHSKNSSENCEGPPRPISSSHRAGPSNGTISSQVDWHLHFNKSMGDRTWVGTNGHCTPVRWSAEAGRSLWMDSKRSYAPSTNATSFNTVTHVIRVNRDYMNVFWKRRTLVLLMTSRHLRSNQFRNYAITIQKVKGCNLKD